MATLTHLKLRYPPEPTSRAQTISRRGWGAVHPAGGRAAQADHVAGLHAKQRRSRAH